MKVNRPYADCKTDELHLADSVQPFGALLAVDRDGIVRAVSANVGAYLGRPAQDLLGVPWHTDLPEALNPEAIGAATVPDASSVRNTLGEASEPLDADPSLDTSGLSGLRLVSFEHRGERRTAALHRAGDKVLVEVQDVADAEFDEVAGIDGLLRAIDALGAATDPNEAASVLMRAVADLVGFDRTLLYRFLPDWHGEVIDEAIDERAAPGMDRYLGLRFPEGDVPANARRLYLRKRQRIIADVDAEPVPVLAGVPGLELDLTGSELRSVHPVHLEYLRNMGVHASFSVSIVVGGALWGLVACHHTTPRRVSFGARRACELIASVASIHIANLARLERMRADVVHALERERVRGELNAADFGAIRFEATLPRLRALYGADGAWARLDGTDIEHGRLPEGAARRRWATWFRSLDRHRPTAVDRPPDELADDDALAERAAGTLYVPLGDDDFLALCRTEQVEHVAWSGRPPGRDGTPADDRTPRNSFAVWRESTRGQSTPWTDVEVDSATALRTMVLESRERADLEHRARLDPLTGLANRATFDEELRSALRHDAEAGIVVVMIDLDRFKPVNDRHGHAVGDQLLRHVAERLRGIVRTGDRVARYGGDEFVALLREVHGSDAASETAARIVRTLRVPYDLDGTVVEVGASVGAVVAQDDPTAPAELLLERADRALYAAKRTGLGGFALYEPGMEASEA